MKKIFYNMYCKAIVESTEELNAMTSDVQITEMNRFERLPELMEQIGILTSQRGGKTAVSQLNDIDWIKADDDLQFLIRMGAAYNIQPDTVLEAGLHRLVATGMFGLKALGFLVTLYGFTLCLALEDPQIIRMRVETMIPQYDCLKGGEEDE